MKSAAISSTTSQLESGLVALLVGDVSGKGVGAALLMANIQASLRTRFALGQGLSAIAEAIDRDIEANSPGPVRVRAPHERRDIVRGCVADRGRTTGEHQGRLEPEGGTLEINLLGLYMIVVASALAYMLTALWPSASGIDKKEWAPTIQLLGRSYTMANETRLTLIVMTTGALGSFVHAATSFGTYVGNQRLYLSWLWRGTCSGPSSGWGSRSSSTM